MYYMIITVKYFDKPEITWKVNSRDLGEEITRLQSNPNVEHIRVDHERG